MKVLKENNTIISMTFLFFMGSCSNHKNADKIINRDTSGIIQKTNKIVKSDTTAITNITKNATKKYFIKDCAKWNENSFGALQGLNERPKDSASQLCFSACYDCPETYEIIFAYRGGVEARKLIGNDSISNDFFKGCKNLYVDFDCFAFEIKMRDPQKQEDMHATKYSFPVYTKVYKRLIADEWAFIKKIKVNSYQEYRNLQFNTIYGLGAK